MGGCKRLYPLHRQPATKIRTEKGKIATYGSNNHIQHIQNSPTEKAEENHASTEAHNQVNVKQAVTNMTEAMEQKEVHAPQTPTAKK